MDPVDQPKAREMEASCDSLELSQMGQIPTCIIIFKAHQISHDNRESEGG